MYCDLWCLLFILLKMTSSGLHKVEEQSRKTSDFSIEHILNKAGPSPSLPPTGCVINYESFKLNECATPNVPFTWLQCTRYCPPKVPRRREGPQKRQLGRHPRIPFSSHQLAVLEERFRQSPYLSSEEVTKLSRVLQLADMRVKIWFQNRRARERRERQQTEEQHSPTPSTSPKLELWSTPSTSTSPDFDSSPNTSPDFNQTPLDSRNNLMFQYMIKEERID